MSEDTNKNINEQLDENIDTDVQDDLFDDDEPYGYSENDSEQQIQEIERFIAKYEEENGIQQETATEDDETSEFKEESLYIIIPAYNEESNIEKTVEEWYPILNIYNNESCLVVVNDGSTDNTYEILQKMQETYPKLIVLDKENGGHGAAVMHGYQYAVDNCADMIFQTDADGQTRAEDFDYFIRHIKYHDAIIGKRTKRGDGASRKFVEDSLCAILRVIFGVKLEDANAPFRLMRTKLVEKYLGLIEKDEPLPNVMLSVYFAYYKENVQYRNISFGKRTAGKNSINVIKIANIGKEAVKRFKQYKKTMP